MSVQTGSSQLTITPGGPLRGSYNLPGDKSLSHRAALLAGLAEGQSVVENFLVAGVTQAMLAALTALQVPWELDGSTLTVSSPGIKHWQAPQSAIDCGNSATTLRLLAGALAAAGIPAVLDGSSGLRRRPMGRIVAPLQQMGVPIQVSPDNTAPLVLQARQPGQRFAGRDIDAFEDFDSHCLQLRARTAAYRNDLVTAGFVLAGHFQADTTIGAGNQNSCHERSFSLLEFTAIIPQADRRANVTHNQHASADRGSHGRLCREFAALPPGAW